jgi:hypothetical protein
MKTFLQFMLINESFKDAKRVWAKNTDKTDIDFEPVISTFKKLKEANFLSGQEKDISYWIPKGYKEFVLFVYKKQEEFNSYKEAKELHQTKSSDATKVFENEFCYVYTINSHEAACKYGAGTQWCVTQKGNPTYWHQYYEQNKLTFYFILSKTEPKDNPYYKIAVTVYKQGINEIYDATDKLINEEEFTDICDQDKIDKEIFVPREIITFGKTLEGKTEEEQLELCLNKWKETTGDLLPIIDGHIIIGEFRNQEDFAEECGNDVAEWCIRTFNGDSDYYPEDVYEDNIKDMFDYLDKLKVEEYIKKEYPTAYDADEDEESEVEEAGGAYEFLKDNRDQVYDDCRNAAADGDRYGAEEEMSKYYDSALKEIEILINGDEIDEQAYIVGKKWDEPIHLGTDFSVIKKILCDTDLLYELENGVSFKFKVEQPYYGFSGFSKEGAKDSLENNSEVAGDLI